MNIVKAWRDMDSPGRFLKQDDVTKLWNDVGNEEARERHHRPYVKRLPRIKYKLVFHPHIDLYSCKAYCLTVTVLNFFHLIS